MRLSDHFTFEEACFSDTATRNGIKNEPGVDEWANMRKASDGMESVRTLLGRPIRINSWYRCEELERILCKKDYEGWLVRRGLTRDDESWALYFAGKAHPKGWAIDFTCADYGTPKDIVRFLQSTALTFDQLLFEGTWVHISFAPTLRREVLTASFGASGVPTYTQGVV